MTIGERIKELMIESNINSSKLADWIGVSPTAVHKYLYEGRIPKAEILINISKVFDVSVDWLLGLSEYRNYNGFISGDDALEYCEMAKESAWKCWYKVANYDVTEIPASKLANNTQACAYFEREIIRWEYDIPRMIHQLVEQTD